VEAPAGLRLTIGHTLPAGQEVEAVTLDGAPSAYEVVETIRGREVRVETSTGAVHMLAVTTSAESIDMPAQDTTLVDSLAGDTLRIPARRDKQPLEDTSAAEAPSVGTSAGVVAMPETMLIGGSSDESHRISALKMAPG
jgi:hypothetical protein